MKTISIAASRRYDVRIGPGLRKEAGAQLASLFPGKRVMLVSDDRVWALYGEEVEDSLRAAGLDRCRFVFPHGERQKNLDTWSRLLEALCAASLTRGDVIAALGGGVVGDLAGFAAAAYRRGIPFVQLPTTLLAAVDSSVGGKTGLDLAGGKNQVGAFYQPWLVLCDTETLDTLPPEEVLGGSAEVVKYAMIGSEKLMQVLEADPAAARSEDVIAACVEMKRDYVLADEFDTGCRQMLNFGHTFGHAAELLSDYRIPHGQAVAMGMAVMTRSAAASGLCSRESADRLLGLLRRMGLPDTIPFPAEDVARAARSDKKAQGSRLTLIVPERVGVCRAETVEASELTGWLHRGGRT